MFENVLVMLIVLCAGFFVLRRFYRTLFGRSRSCGCESKETCPPTCESKGGCSGCT